MPASGGRQHASDRQKADDRCNRYRGRGRLHCLLGPNPARPKGGDCHHNQEQEPAMPDDLVGNLTADDTAEAAQDGAANLGGRVKRKIEQSHRQRCDQ